MPDVNLRQDVLGHYQDYYRDGPSMWRRLGALDKAGNILALCSGRAVNSVLEIGAGDGAVLSRLAELGFGSELYALEISASGVEVITSQKIPGLVECALFDGYTVPHPDGRFDLAILSHVIEHVEHPRQLLYEAARVARFVFVEVPTEDISRRPADYSPTPLGHINFFSPRTIRWLLQSCGLRVLSHRTTNPSKATYVYEAGSTGLMRFYTKQILLRVVPKFATRHFCYHEALLATGALAEIARPESPDHQI